MRRTRDVVMAIAVALALVVAPMVGAAQPPARAPPASRRSHSV